MRMHGFSVIWPFSKSSKTDISAIVAETEALIRRIAMDLSLKVLKEEDAECFLYMHFPAQANLNDELGIVLQESDEVTLEVKNVSFAEIHFQEEEAEFEETLRGLLSGRYRLVIWAGENAERPYRGEIQIPEGGQWVTISTYALGWDYLFKRTAAQDRRVYFLRSADIQNLNPFQQSCFRDVQEIARRHDQSLARVETLVGDASPEAWVEIETEPAGLAVWIHEDGAEFKLGRDECRLEQADFKDGPEQLRQAFVRELDKRLKMAG